jgi:hypothetical protein
MKEPWASPALRQKSGQELPALAAAYLELLEGRAFVDGQVVGPVALDEVLRLLFRGVPPVALEGDRRGDFLLDRSPDPARFRVPLDMIAPLQVACRTGYPTARVPRRVWTSPGMVDTQLRV